MRLAMSIIVPATVTVIKLLNRQNDIKKHLCGSEEVQLGTGEVLGSMLSQAEAYAICEEPKLGAVGAKIANNFLDKVGEHIKPMDV